MNAMNQYLDQITSRPARVENYSPTEPGPTWKAKLGTFVKARLVVKRWNFVSLIITYNERGIQQDQLFFIDARTYPQGYVQVRLETLDKEEIRVITKQMKYPLEYKLAIDKAAVRARKLDEDKFDELLHFFYHINTNWKRVVEAFDEFFSQLAAVDWHE